LPGLLTVVGGRAIIKSISGQVLRHPSLEQGSLGAPDVLHEQRRVRRH